MRTLITINEIIIALFAICYLYQFFYIPVSLLAKERKPELKPVPHDFAVLICARNESAVIGDLCDSLKAQTYPAEQIHIFVMADNCTDDTASIAKAHGATVYTRSDTQNIGKGFALEALLGHIAEDYPAGFDGYFVFDADNLLEPDYIEQMNRTFSDGNDIITSYRNSKNYGDNWISAGYALWFLRESKYLNYPRYLLRTSCAVSGTGFLFSRKVLEEIGGWPFHMLVEDIEFTVNRITSGYKIAFCKNAVLYDEQPVTFRQSWRQRLRWSRGYLQVFGGYGKALIKGAFKGSFSCYDMSMTIMPAFILSLLSVICNLVIGIWGALTGQYSVIFLTALIDLVYGMYGLTFIIGLITTITEWKVIRTTAFKKILYLLTFPLFMMTYLPITVAALFAKPEWKPIHHTVTAKQFLADGRSSRSEQ